MTRTKSLKASPCRMHDLIRRLQKKADKRKTAPIQLNKKSLIGHHFTVTAFRTDVISIEVEVKTAILKTTGQNDPDATTIKNDDKMSKFGFTEFQYISLTKKFLKIAQTRKPSAKIELDDVSEADKVKDCIDLVTTACK